MTYEQIKDFLNSDATKHSYQDTFSELFFQDELYGDLTTYSEQQLGCTFSLVEDVGGEGQGELYYKVYSFTAPDQDPIYIKFEGYYYSYDGATFDDFYQVTPVEKIITVYESL